VTRGESIPKKCPACGSNDVKDDYNAETLLREVIEDDNL